MEDVKKELEEIKKELEKIGNEIKLINLIEKKVRFVKGDYKGKEGIIVGIRYSENGITAEILVDKKILKYSKDFWELI